MKLCCSSPGLLHIGSIGHYSLVGFWFAFISNMNRQNVRIMSTVELCDVTPLFDVFMESNSIKISWDLRSLLTAPDTEPKHTSWVNISFTATPITQLPLYVGFLWIETFHTWAQDVCLIIVAITLWIQGWMALGTGELEVLQKGRQHREKDLGSQHSKTRSHWSMGGEDLWINDTGGASNSSHLALWKGKGGGQNKDQRVALKSHFRSNNTIGHVWCALTGWPVGQRQVHTDR